MFDLIKKGCSLEYLKKMVYKQYKHKFEKDNLKIILTVLKSYCEFLHCCYIIYISCPQRISRIYFQSVSCLQPF